MKPIIINPHSASPSDRKIIKTKPIESVRQQPYLARYALNWGRMGDIGHVASTDTSPIGAVSFFDLNQPLTWRSRDARSNVATIP